MDIRSLVKQILIQKENRRYGKLLTKCRMTYDEWIRETENQDAEKAAGVWQTEQRTKAVFRCFVTSEGTAAVNMLSVVAQYFCEHPTVQILYADEDVLVDGVRKSPWFKPDWSPDLLESCFYFGSVVAVREELIERVEEAFDPHYSGKGIQTLGTETKQIVSVMSDGLAEVYHIEELSAFEKWVHGAAALAGAYSRNRNAVGHIAKILFHCESEEQQKKFLETSEFLQNTQQESLRDFRDGWAESCAERSDGNNCVSEPIISIVIPSKDHPKILEQCIRSCCKGTRGIKTEILVADNGSNIDNKCYIEKMIRNLKQELEIEIIYLYQPMKFHFSKMCNLGAQHSTGDFLLFLNDDVELVAQDTIMRMVALAERPWTGAVGLKLCYPHSDRIQHAGITNLPMGPVHKLQFLSDSESYYFNSNRGLRNVVAVTAACLMVEKEKFDAVGGFSEELPIAFNDVDFCFSLYESGYHNVCLNDIYAYHHESLSRGDDESVENRARLMAELAKLYERHPKLKGVDPYYSKHLNREGLDTRIRPACETAGNRMQWIAGKLSGINLAPGRGKEYREDPCVLLRVESLEDGMIQGYSVILGDDNACYEKKLLLISEPQQEEKTGICEETMAEVKEKLQTGEKCTEIYSVDIVEQYRPDLTENMQDQTNVGLSGFWMKLSAETLSTLPKGRYRVGIAVRNRVTGLRLTNESNCYLIND